MEHGQAGAREVPHHRLTGDVVPWYVVHRPIQRTMIIDEEAGYAQDAEHPRDDGQKEGIRDRPHLVTGQRIDVYTGKQPQTAVSHLS